MVITGKVAKILNGRELIINMGSDAGVESDMKFRIFEEQVDITDPDTGVSLGTLQREKIRINITEVQLKFAVGRTFETYQFYEPDPSGGIFPFTRGFPRRVTRVRTLKTQDDPIAIGDENVASVVTGDLVIQLEGESNSATVEE